MKTKQKYGVIKKLLFTGLWVTSFCAQAVNILQVGAPGTGGLSDFYANYQASSSNPTEDDTAIISGNTLYAAGAYKEQNQELLIGGKYTSISGSGLDWTTLTNNQGNPLDHPFDSSFAGHGAILMATVANGTLGVAGNSITVNGASAIFSTSTYESGFTMPNPPSNHAPVPGNDYLFFDIGDFAKTGSVPDFASETGSAPGEIKTLTLAISGFGWVHFDLMALVTDSQGQTTILTNLKGNPGSHDVTWKTPPPPPPGGDTVPEPGILSLLGLGLLGLGARKRRKNV